MLDDDIVTPTAAPHQPALPRDPRGDPVDETRVLLARARALELLAGPVRHDLANSLNALSLFAGVVELEGGVPDDMRRDLGRAADAATRIGRLTSLFLDLARGRPRAPRQVEVAGIVADVADLAGSLLVGVDSAIAIPDDLPDVEVDPGAARLAILLVVLAALRALGAPRARGRLRLEARAGSDGRTVELAILDDAGRTENGLTEDLAVARDLLRSDGGNLLAGTSSGATHRAVAVLPRVATAHRAEGASDLAGGEGASDLAGGMPAAPPIVSPDAVLVCDDEPVVRAILGRMIEKSGLRVVEAASGEQALEVLDQEPVRLVIADQHMEQLLGTDLYAVVAERHPTLARRFILMTGDPTEAGIVGFARAHRLTVLAKPFDLSEVARLLGRALGTGTGTSA